MITPAAYILRVSSHRRRVLLNPNLSHYTLREETVAEPVPKFDHSTRAPLVVLPVLMMVQLPILPTVEKGRQLARGLFV